MNLRGILLAPVPRIYDESPDGAVTLEGQARPVGMGMDVEAIPRAAEEARIRIHTEVLDPLTEWMEAYKVLTVR